MTNKAELRQFIMSYFSDDELNTLCFDYFREVLNNFTASMTKSQKIIDLIGYCERRDLMENLHAALAALRPEPYQELIGSPPIFQPRERIEGRSPNRIFLSHASQDAGFAQQLADDLRRHNYDVWMAPYSIEPGEKWIEAIERGLESSGIFLLVMTPNAAKSKWVKDESNYAIELENQGEVRFITLDVAEGKMPPMWRLRQHISFRQDYDEGLRKLLSALRPVKSNQTASTTQAPPPSSRMPRWIPILIGLTMVLSALTLVRSILPSAEDATPPAFTEPAAVAGVTQPPTTVITVIHEVTSHPGEPATITPLPSISPRPTIEPTHTREAPQPEPTPMIVVVTAAPLPTYSLPPTAVDTPTPAATATPTATSTPTETPTPTMTPTRTAISSIYDIPINRAAPAIPDSIDTTYIEIQDDAGAVSVKVPVEWLVDPSNLTQNGQVIGSRLLAAPDIDGFRSTYATPGVEISASPHYGGLDMNESVDLYREYFSSDCTFEGRYDYNDLIFTGVLDHYINCDALGDRLIVLFAKPDNQAYGLVLVAQAVTEADRSTLDNVLRTFNVIGVLPGQ